MIEPREAQRTGPESDLKPSATGSLGHGQLRLVRGALLRLGEDTQCEGHGFTQTQFAGVAGMRWRYAEGR